MDHKSNLDLLKSESVAFIEIKRPDLQNAFNRKMWGQLIDICKTIEADDRISMVVVQSSTPNIFCAGADISEFSKFRNDPELAMNNAILIRNAIDAVFHLSVPTFARIEGSCFGGGAALALACDFRFATVNSRFAITPAKLGLTYAIEDIKLLIATVGLPMARRMLLTAEVLDAQQSLEAGLVDQLFHQSDEMDDKIRNMSTNLRRLSDHSLQEIKKNICKVVNGQGVGDAESISAFVDSFSHNDLQEGMQAFLEKRNPRFN